MASPPTAMAAPYGNTIGKRSLVLLDPSSPPLLPISGVEVPTEIRSGEPSPPAIVMSPIVTPASAPRAASASAGPWADRALACRRQQQICGEHAAADRRDHQERHDEFAVGPQRGRGEQLCVAGAHEAEDRAEDEADGQHGAETDQTGRASRWLAGPSARTADTSRMIPSTYRFGMRWIRMSEMATASNKAANPRETSLTDEGSAWPCPSPRDLPGFGPGVADGLNYGDGGAHVGHRIHGHRVHVHDHFAQWVGRSRQRRYRGFRRSAHTRRPSPLLSSRRNRPMMFDTAGFSPDQCFDDQSTPAFNELLKPNGTCRRPSSRTSA